ncbi:MAG: hypothetical protein IPO63_00420 [Bacteroidetes bacterium]|nr:hypothetical protein [Bacteroidota bacterium]
MQKIIIILTTFASIFIMSCNSNSTPPNFKSEKESLTINEAYVLLNENAVLIDVREPNELVEQSYDVKNWINIPLDSIEIKINNIPSDKQVILACQSGRRSQLAFEILKAKGYINIANLEGGMNAWTKAGKPTKTSKVEKESCCDDPSSSNCNPDGTCKSIDEKTTISGNNLTKNHLEVYVFHGTRQCETCKHMKAYTKETLDNYFSEQLKNGSIVFAIVDVDDAANEMLAAKFEATGTALMINNVVNGQDHIADWSNFAFEKANVKNKFVLELKTMINEVLKKQNGNTSSIN